MKQHEKWRHQSPPPKNRDNEALRDKDDGVAGTTQRNKDTGSSTHAQTDGRSKSTSRSSVSETNQSKISASSQTVDGQGDDAAEYSTPLIGLSKTGEQAWM